jgi:hypothetical protein
MEQVQSAVPLGQSGQTDFYMMPLVSGTSFIDSVNQYLTEFYTQIVGSL